MKLKKIALHYREMNECHGATPEEIGQVVIFRTKEGGYGIRRRCHGWNVGDTVWTADGTQPTTVIALAGPEKFEVLYGIIRNATYSVNRFDCESERNQFLKNLERALLANAA